jgi:hypothetical protein
LDKLGWPWPKHPCFEDRFRFRGVVSKIAITATVSEMPPAALRRGKGRRKVIIIVVPPHRELSSSNASELIPRMSKPELKRALIDAHKKQDLSLYNLLKDAQREMLRSATARSTPRASPKPAPQESVRGARKRRMNRIKGKNW